MQCISRQKRHFISTSPTPMERRIKTHLGLIYITVVYIKVHKYTMYCTYSADSTAILKYIHGTLRPKIASCVFQQKAAPKNVPPISCKCLQFCVLSVSLDSHLQSGQSCRKPDLKFLLLSLRLHQIKLICLNYQDKK